MQNKNQKRNIYARNFKIIRSEVLHLHKRPRTTHVHVVSQDGEAKFIVADEVTLLENVKMKPKDVKLAESIIEDNKDLIKTSWKNIHGSKD